MRLRPEHAKFIGDKIARDLANCEFVKLTTGLDPVSAVGEKHILEDIVAEKEVTGKVHEIMDAQDEEIEFYQADRKQLFGMIRRKIANEMGFNLDREERYSNVSHTILDELYEEDLIHFSVSDTRVKNVITNAIFDYIKKQDEIDDRVHEKIKHYKRKVDYGTEEYDIIFQKLYEEELRKLGM